MIDIHVHNSILKFDGFSVKGKMGFSSAGLGSGCTFFFELPLYPQPTTPETTIKLPISDDDDGSHKPSWKTLSKRKSRNHTFQVSAANTSTQLVDDFAVSPMEENSLHIRLGDDHLNSVQSSVAKSTRNVTLGAANNNFDHVFHQILRQRHYQGGELKS